MINSLYNIFIHMEEHFRIGLLMRKKRQETMKVNHGSPVFYIHPLSAIHSVVRPLISTGRDVLPPYTQYGDDQFQANMHWLHWQEHCYRKSKRLSRFHVQMCHDNQTPLAST